MSELHRLIKDLCPDGVEYKELHEFLTIKNGSDYKKFGNGDIPVYGSGGIIAYIDKFAFNKPSVLIPRKGSVDKLYYVDTPFWNVDTIFYTDIDTTKVIPRYVYYCLLREHLEQYNNAGGVPSLTQKVLNKVKIPVPSLEVQREIVRILDEYSEKVTALQHELKKELDLRKKQYEYYRDKLLTFGDGVQRKSLGEIGKVSMCKRIMKNQTNSESGVPFFKIGTFGKTADSYISFELFNEYKQKYSYPKKSDVLISASGTIGRTVIFDGKPAYFQDSNIVWIDNDESIVLNKYLYYFYQTNPWKISEGGTIARLYNYDLTKIKIPVPPIEEQKRIVKILDKFDSLCNDLTRGIPAEINARQKQYEYYRDRLLNFKEKQ
ncbi:MAG: restriction endonuclease subunit S [Ruminococcus sp.]|nr:restriction endonuclease subunit S [Ruminococcus sp.]